MNMKKKFLMAFTIAIVVLVAMPCMAQQQGSVTFSYDGNGNRILRSITFARMGGNGEKGDDKGTPVVSAKDVFANLEVSIYPNPTHDRVLLSVGDNRRETPVHARLATLAGATLWEGTVTCDVESIDLSGQASGVYLLELNAEGERHVWKVVKR